MKADYHQRTSGVSIAPVLQLWYPPPTMRPYFEAVAQCESLDVTPCCWDCLALPCQPLQMTILCEAPKKNVLTELQL